MPLRPTLFVGPKLRSGVGLDPVGQDENTKIAALVAEIKALKTAAMRTTTPASATAPSPTADATHVYGARASAQVNYARSVAAAERHALDNPEAQIPQHRPISMVVDGAGGNQSPWWPGHPTREPGHTTTDIDMFRMPAGHTHQSMDRSMMLLLNVQQQQLAQQNLQQQQLLQQQHYMQNISYLFGGFQPPRHN